MTEDELDARWKRKLEAQRDLGNEAYDLICDIAEIEGGLSEVERTKERADVWAWVMSLPRYDKAARARIYEETN
jgi:hypothetical protein